LRRRNGVRNVAESRLGSLHIEIAHALEKLFHVGGP
jgi:hypothetical protein